MTATGRWLMALALIAGLANAQAARKPVRPYIGYLCAAGAQRGTVVNIAAGGQNLRGAKRVIISGEGVTARVIRHQRTPWLLKPEERRAVAQALRRMANRKAAAARNPNRKRRDAPGKKDKKQPGKPGAAKDAPPPLPDHPMLKHIDSLTPKELRRVAYEFLDPARRSQLSAQIAEVVEMEVRVDANALPGERELRIETGQGLTNPVPFQVGLLPEFFEEEPNDYPTSPQPVVELPRVLNGQVSFKDIDRFRFRARHGQKLVIEAQARRLVPYLADAVPGWFQATLTVYDRHGDEISFVDDYRFDPDPVVFFEVPEDGEYVLEIRDAIYRGREDFVYRITVAERPFITSVFPLGGPEGSMTIAEVGGWNLPWDYVVLDTWPGPDRIRQSTWNSAGPRTNTIHYAVGDLPECIEAEPTGAPRPPIKLPMIVNGRISAPGEVDVVHFEGRIGKEVVAEVQARRLGSPLDSLLQLVRDDDGRVIAWNDDHMDRGAGLVTHQADSYLHVKLPASGSYSVRLADAQGHGGEAYGYRLRVSPPRPDFEVIVTPASLNAPGGALIPVTAHAVRQDGFAGEIELAVAEPEGFLLSGGKIPAGRDRVRLTVAAPPRRTDLPVHLKIVGRARIAGRTVTRAAIPAEDMMQAFGLRHLVPARQLLVAVTRGGRRGPPLRLASDRPARIPAGGSTEVRIITQRPPDLEKTKFVLTDPPPGVSLRRVKGKGQSLILVLQAERGKAQVGLADNLMFDAYVTYVPGQGRNKAKGKGRAKGKAKAKAPQPRQVFAGVLPAVPFVIVRR